jgi:hypothetical protein
MRAGIVELVVGIFALFDALTQTIEAFLPSIGHHSSFPLRAWLAISGLVGECTSSGNANATNTVHGAKAGSSDGR